MHGLCEIAGCAKAAVKVLQCPMDISVVHKKLIKPTPNQWALAEGCFA
jgi:hypothetical protein